jgi:uncharacterized alkaline shock family protein YloU
MYMTYYLKSMPPTSSPELAKIAHQQTMGHHGVVRMRKDWCDRLKFRKTPGVKTWSDSDGWLYVRVAVVARNESNLYQLGLQIQNAVRTGIREISTQPLGRVDVIVAGIGAAH